jgi:DNA modification methylase
MLRAHMPPRREDRSRSPWSEEDWPRPRRSLDYTGGPTLVAGDPELSQLLAHALDTGELDRDRLTHGFHTYPARMHWATAARIIDALAPENGHVVDPFCGSGTVLIEARVAGRASTGIDLNPLAVRLSKLKSEPMPRPLLEELALLGSDLRERSEQRVQARDPVRAKLPREELAWYDTHVLKEMAGLLEEIEQVEHGRLREACLLVFSSLVVKFSRQRSDTSEHAVERRLRKGLVSEFFERKTYELCERLAALEAECQGPRPRIVEGDARDVGRMVPGRADLILTSPPYGGTYDYVAHHQRRFAWLGLDPKRFAASEIGARRHGDHAGRFEQELLEVMSTCAEALRPGALLVMLMGDARTGGEDMSADELVAELADEAGLEPLREPLMVRERGQQRLDGDLALV